MTLPALRSQSGQPSQDTRQYDALHELEQLRQRLNQLVASILDSPPLGSSFVGDGAWTPLADLTETNDAYLVEIELPGVNRKDLTVELAGNELRVSGEFVEKEKAGWLRHRTRRVGQFAYHTLLPAGLDTDHVTADLADGVLTVRVPKTEAAKPRRITVNAG